MEIIEGLCSNCGEECNPTKLYCYVCENQLKQQQIKEKQEIKDKYDYKY